LQVQGPAASTENLDLIPPGADQQDRAFQDKNLVFIDAGLNEDLIVGTGILVCGAGS
jgi:hypothetical protein